MRFTSKYISVNQHESKQQSRNTYLKWSFYIEKIAWGSGIKVHKSEIAREPGVWWCTLVLNMYSQWLQNEYIIYINDLEYKIIQEIIV